MTFMNDGAGHAIMPLAKYKCSASFVTWLTVLNDKRGKE